ncbi:hypothetical protein DC094_02970 [Pelagibaculum spongiae]|uniref:Uncharacterized protein n=1 Tax=Pelagibaculum spongiae TaxID=2080658 RepID=A0A2V1GZY9_9GAMM|nr:hypothetical protein DC094_02970 [Pelagibaculum spongiae]
MIKNAGESLDSPAFLFPGKECMSIGGRKPDRRFPGKECMSIGGRKPDRRFPGKECMSIVGDLQDVRSAENARSNFLSGSRIDDFQGRNVYRKEGWIH